MTVLMINDEIRQDIKKLIKTAEDNIVPMFEMNQNGELKLGDPNPIGDNSEHVMDIPNGYRVVFSIEDQGEGEFDGKTLLGKCRHISVSVGSPNSAPAMESMDMIIKEFGFSPLYDCIVWPEAFGNSAVAINVVEPINGFQDNILTEVRKSFLTLMEKQIHKGYARIIVKNIKMMRGIE